MQLLKMQTHFTRHTKETREKSLKAGAIPSHYLVLLTRFCFHLRNKNKTIKKFIKSSMQFTFRVCFQPLCIVVHTGIKGKYRHLVRRDKYSRTSRRQWACAKTFHESTQCRHEATNGGTLLFGCRITETRPFARTPRRERHQSR